MAPCLVPSVLVWGREGGRRPASSLQGPSHCPPERAPPWTGKMAQRPQLPSRAGGRGGQAASCVLSPPAPQTPPPQLALWALRAAWQAALTVCPGCHWPSPQTPELGRALGAAGRPCPPSGPFLVLPAAVCPLLSVSGLSPARTSSLHRRWASALCLRWPWGVEVPSSCPRRGLCLHDVIASWADAARGLCRVQVARAPHSAVAPVQCHWGPGGLGAFDSGRSPRSHAER